MNTQEEDTNELSWLKGGPKSHDSSNSISPRPIVKDDTPSWVFEDAPIDEGKNTPTGRGNPTKLKEMKAGKGTIKWKTKNYAHDDDDDGADDSSSCCCCCPSDPVLFSFQCFHFTSGLTGLAAFVANIYTFWNPNLGTKDAIIRGYTLLFCILIVIVELDWRFVVNKVRFLDYWVLRGLFYTFVGFITCKYSCKQGVDCR